MKQMHVTCYVNRHCIQGICKMTLFKIITPPQQVVKPEVVKPKVVKPWCRALYVHPPQHSHSILRSAYVDGDSIHSAVTSALEVVLERVLFSFGNLAHHTDEDRLRGDKCLREKIQLGFYSRWLKLRGNVRYGKISGVVLGIKNFKESVCMQA